MIKRHLRQVIRVRTSSGKIIDSVSISKAIDILLPYYPPKNIPESQARTSIRNRLRKGEKLYSEIYYYFLDLKRKERKCK